MVRIALNRNNIRTMALSLLLIDWVFQSKLKKTNAIHCYQRKHCTFWCIHLPTNFYDWLTSVANSKSRCRDDKDYFFDKGSWSIINGKISMDYHDKLDKVMLEGHTFPCLHSDGFCKPTLMHPYTVLCSLEGICLIFHNSDFIARISKLNKRYWLEVDDFFDTIGKTLKTLSKAYCQLYFVITIHHWQLLLQLYQDRKSSNKKTLFAKNRHNCLQLSILIFCQLSWRFWYEHWK